MLARDCQDTIVAPATPPGEGGIGILRLSGGRAEELLRTLFAARRRFESFRSHQLYYGHIRAPEGEIVDEVLAVLMRAPHSYTREDVVEVHCHGGSLVLRRILDLFIDSGARLARPGEFTQRAFLNGRLDLAQAEAVIDIIRAASDDASRLAVDQLGGKLSNLIYRFRQQLVEQLALLEVHIDFPDDDIELPSRSRLVTGVGSLVGEIDDLLASFDSGRVLREGISLLILGKPNVGKSTLMNALLGEERAIVTDIAGTTRDLIEEPLTLGGLPLRLIDTAGIRETADPIEQEGMRRAKDKAAAADLVLWVLDGSRPLDGDDLLALAACGGRRAVAVLNKADLGAAGNLSLPDLPTVQVSARDGKGIDRLKAIIHDLFLGRAGGEARESFLLSDRRHREALVRARRALGEFLDRIDADVAPEYLALDLRAALEAFGEITGETAPDAILDQIFSRFCIGK